MPRRWSSAPCWACLPPSISLLPWERSNGTSTTASRPATTPTTARTCRRCGRTLRGRTWMRGATASLCSGWTARWVSGGAAYWCPKTHTGLKSLVRRGTYGYVLLLLVVHSVKNWCLLHFSFSLFSLSTSSFPDPIMVTKCQAFTLPQQWESKYRSPGNINSGEDLLRTCTSWL